MQLGHASPPAVASAAAGAAASASTWPISRRDASIMGNVSSRVGLRTHLRCRSFRWYLDHVWPDHEFPVHPTRIRHVASRLCVDASSGEDTVSAPPSVGRRLELRSCEDEYDASRGHGAGAPVARSDLQHFELISNSAELRLSPVLEGAVRAAGDVSAARGGGGGAGHTGTLCWRPTADAMHVELGACGRAQRWGRTSEGHLVHLSTRRCLVAQPVDEGGGRAKFRLALEPAGSARCREPGQWRWKCNGAQPPPPFVRETADERVLGASKDNDQGETPLVTRALCSTQRLTTRRNGHPGGRVAPTTPLSTDEKVI